MVSSLSDPEMCQDHNKSIAEPLHCQPLSQTQVMWGWPPVLERMSDTQQTQGWQRPWPTPWTPQSFLVTVNLLKVLGDCKHTLQALGLPRSLGSPWGSCDQGCLPVSRGLLWKLLVYEPCESQGWAWVWDPHYPRACYNINVNGKDGLCSKPDKLSDREYPHRTVWSQIPNWAGHGGQFHSGPINPLIKG